VKSKQPKTHKRPLCAYCGQGENFHSMLSGKCPDDVTYYQPKMKSKREDGRGHRQPLSQTEDTVVYTVKVTVSELIALRAMPKGTVREWLIKLIRRK